MNDKEKTWIAQAQSDQDQAFANLVEAYQKQVFSVCYRMLGNANDAEDAAQEAFLRAYTNIKSFDPDRSFATWLLSIASHHCIDRLRKKTFAVLFDG